MYFRTKVGQKSSAFGDITRTYINFSYLIFQTRGYKKFSTDAPPNGFLYNLNVPPMFIWSFADRASQWLTNLTHKIFVLQ